MAEHDVIDEAALERLTEWGGEKLLHEMIRLFLENSGKRLDQIGDGFEQDEVEQVERGAHSLKSSAGNVGAGELSRLAATMEDRAAAGDLDGARALHESLTTAHEIASARLRELQKGHES